jgi:hypothetical protein
MSIFEAIAEAKGRIVAAKADADDAIESLPVESRGEPRVKTPRPQAGGVLLRADSTADTLVEQLDSPR